MEVEKETWHAACVSLRLPSSSEGTHTFFKIQSRDWLNMFIDISWRHLKKVISKQSGGFSHISHAFQAWWNQMRYICVCIYSNNYRLYSIHPHAHTHTFAYRFSYSFKVIICDMFFSATCILFATLLRIWMWKPPSCNPPEMQWKTLGGVNHMFVFPVQSELTTLFSFKVKYENSPFLARCCWKNWICWHETCGFQNEMATYGALKYQAEARLGVSHPWNSAVSLPYARKNINVIF